MAREDLAGSEIDDRDLPLVNDGEDTAAGMGRADLEVVHAAAAPEGHDALGVGDVVAEAEVAAAVGFRRPCLRPRPVRLARCGSTNRTVRPLLVVGEAEGVELSRKAGEVVDRFANPAADLQDRAFDAVCGRGRGEGRWPGS